VQKHTIDSETPVGRLHRISRLMALVIKLETLLGEQTLRDYTDIAVLGGVSKARMTQIMNLLNLAPDIQEQLLFLPRTTRQRDRICERHLRAVAKLVDRNEQRRLFSAVLGDVGGLECMAGNTFARLLRRIRVTKLSDVKTVKQLAMRSRRRRLSSHAGCGADAFNRFHWRK
jgi:hypothetical protein